MKKYILLFIPIIFYAPSLFTYYEGIDSHWIYVMKIVVNLFTVSICLGLILKVTTLHNVMNWLIAASFVIYFIVLYQQTIFNQFYFDRVEFNPENLSFLFNSVNVIPLRGIIEVIQNSPNAIFQIVGNLIMLTPFAFCMMYFKWAKKMKSAIIYSFFISLFIETIQFIQHVLGLLFNIGFGRSTDMDDIILNTLGAVGGIGCYYIWTKIEKMFHHGGVKKMYRKTNKDF
ncbi:VanZ family protein [Bacillus weihaiensis]|uniref:VanZ-like domain-containing protein n=1 Tax=Bacillus weihaiensis TaxID=1547283 RepID=A0A1L3MRS8_9BACI|nr:VanZ family protein [Bacillus weihaiensis]APH04954.1 hypothetical protein A9C19_09430 [Bacillus weihaiensis]